MPDDHIDPERPHADKPFDRSDGFSGQDYRPEDEAALRQRAAPAPGADGRDIPPDNGRRAAIDERTGEVRGSGVGAGGGQEGEDFDSDAATGGGYPLTGSEGGDKRPGDLGPAHFKE